MLATYLPEVASEQGWDCHEAVVSLIRKSGYQGVISEELLKDVETTKYQSSKQRLTYAEYTHTIQSNPLQSLSVAQSRSRNWKSFFH